MEMGPCAAHGSGVSISPNFETDQGPFKVDQGMCCNIGRTMPALIQKELQEPSDLIESMFRLP
jgi:hypothetical protein